MHTQLSVLRALVVSFLNQENTISPTQVDIDHAIQELPRIREFLFEAMRLEVFSSANDRVIERHIQQVQKDCIDLMNILHGHTGLSDYEPPPAAGHIFLPGTGPSPYRETPLQVFNLKAELPNGYFEISMEDMEQKLKLLKALLKKYKVDEELQQVLWNVGRDFLAKERCTYDELLYFKDVLESILVLESGENGFSAALKEHLLYFRFNSPNFQKYYLKTIMEELDNLYDQQERYEALCRYEKQFREQQERACSNFIDTRESIKYALIDFVKVEIKFLHRKQMSFAFAHPGYKENKSTYRLRVSLSVDGLAYFVRLMVEAGVILSNSKSELLTFISEHIQTPGIGAMKLSVKSLNNKYRQVVQATLNAVRAALMKMLKILEAY